jgi:Small-conductance mechanosensitive channel
MPTETDKTLTQLANELGVSRDKVIYRYKKLPKDAYYKENNTIYIKEEGVQQIIDELGDDLNELSTEHAKEGASEEEILSIHHYLIEQLAKKDEQIDQLQKLIDQQQQLNAEDKKLIKELHQYFALEAPKETTEIKSANEEEPSEAQIKQSEELANQIAKLEEQIKKSEALNQEKERLEQELASLKNKKWYQFWK